MNASSHLVLKVVALSTFLLTFAATLVTYFANPRTSLPVKVVTTLSLALGFFGIFLLPIDLSSASSSTNDLYILWEVIFWGTSVLAWAILPLMRETLLAGEFTTISRFREGVRKVLRVLLIYLLVAIIGIIALAFKLHSFNVLPVLIALGNTYGLIIVSILLGYGLVAFPRALWRQANPESELRRTLIMLVAADEAIFDAVWQLQDCEYAIDNAISQVMDLKDDLPNDVYMKFCIDELLRRKNLTANLSSELSNRRTNHERGEGDLRNKLDSPSTLRQISKLNRNLKLAQEKLISSEVRLQFLFKRAIFYSDLVNGSKRRSSSSNLNTSIPLLSMTDSKIRSCGNYMQYFWRKYLRSHTVRIFAISSVFISSLILWCEATLAINANLSPFSFLLDLFAGGDEPMGYLIVFFSIILLIYVSICVYSSLFKLSFVDHFTLRGHKQSYGVALLFNAQYLVRLQFPLGYNYLLMMKVDTSANDCAFLKLMGKMSVFPVLGTSFSVYAPLLIIALCGFTLFHGYARLLGLLGIEHEDSILLGDKEILDGKVKEGISLLRRHLCKETEADKRQGETCTYVEMLERLNSIV